MIVALDELIFGEPGADNTMRGKAVNRETGRPRVQIAA
jgi:hypothetical protein